MFASVPSHLSRQEEMLRAVRRRVLARHPRPKPRSPYSTAGMVRRMRGLCWMGHGPDEVAGHVGEEVTTVERWLQGLRVDPYVYRVLDVAYEELSGHFGPNDEAAAHARIRNWYSPMAWHDVDIDNVRARPRIDIGIRDSKKIPLLSQVFQALLGIVPASDLLREEKVAAVWHLHRLGWSDRRIAAWLRWNADGDITAGSNAVCKFREREKITGYGASPNSWHGHAPDGEFIVVPSAA